MARSNPTDPPPSADAPAGWPPGVTRESITRAMNKIRQTHEEQHVPGEGLRERKKRLTRQLISDTATWMFCEHGFDRVRVSEIAEEVGVSEKTVYNYFPTKESLVLDREEEITDGIRDALVNRAPETSPTEAITDFIERELTQVLTLDDEFLPMFVTFMRMVQETPALRAASMDVHSRLLDVATEALAQSAQLDPRDPEPRVAAHALVALWEVGSSARMRHTEAGLRGEELQTAIMTDVRRAARLLDTGLWSLNTLATGGRTRGQLADAARAAGEARKQVIEALRQARSAWAEVHRAHEEAHRAAEGTWFERHRAGEAAEKEVREEMLEALRHGKRAIVQAKRQQAMQKARERQQQAHAERQRVREDARERQREAQDERKRAAQKARDARRRP